MLSAPARALKVHIQHRYKAFISADDVWDTDEQVMRSARLVLDRVDDERKAVAYELVNRRQVMDAF